MGTTDRKLTSIEICAGAGGQAVGLHQAGFRHLALVEIDKHAATTLRDNIESRPEWSWEKEHCLVREVDVKEFRPLEEVLAPEVHERGKCDETDETNLIKPGQLDLLAGGVPCPPFSAAGKQLGREDERDLFPRMLDLVEQLKPRAVLIENVRGLLEPEWKFRYYRNHIKNRLRKAGYVICGWRVLEAQHFGVPQLRPRAILVAIREDQYRGFDWPEPHVEVVTVFKKLKPSMERRLGGKDSPLYKEWRRQAILGTVAPTLVGGSKKHGGADLGPTRAKKAWAALGVDAMGVANDEQDMIDPDRDLGNLEKKRGPKLTIAQAALIQGFPKEWEFTGGGKTARYRQVGNAFPPPVAAAVGERIKEALSRTGPLREDPTPEFEPEDDPSLVAPELPLQQALPTVEDDAEDSARALLG
ncbi:DNA (cytosine-5-)-methyltransferase [Streptomyces lunaelactis]|uniref:DNA cytosine methyltransferase n=1 Tax=Streptomyces lunaelactis TaxID=1535768 RepID=UPI0015859C17|nr:DNA (cytosine-5-)-methyltransferase [Streptomyces lunaelactis]NUK00272.1 DNA (cytosine-5-)-methyltransferase [Streptomyces lunaelactis]NUK18389.1 DNA (cytosine-5-)-methyltransferase [Streptomyces lunaelactis]NUK51306.1 DNA (cytosine-5-)-methyltransferase [Streptomyces lunaelactis]NUK64678.1 DNA (cytosine-5-)-methyltransferase [Streptomyces lunaelactis]